MACWGGNLFGEGTVPGGLGTVTDTDTDTDTTTRIVGAAGGVTKTATLKTKL